jgi:hypothetical protein
MQCNIDAKGKAVRLVAGAAIEATGWTLGALGFLGILSEWALYVGALAIVGGLVMVFEGLAGWCVIRALGIRTPL